MVITDFALGTMNRPCDTWGTFQPYDPVAKTEKSRKGLAFLAFAHPSFLYLQTLHQESI